MGRIERDVRPSRQASLVVTAAAVVAGAVVPVACGPATAFAQGGAALLSKPLDEMARPNPLQGLPQGAQNMAQNFANGGAPQAAAAVDTTPPPEVSLFTVKYIPAYFVTVLAAGLGLFTVCKFSGRRRDV